MPSLGADMEAGTLVRWRVALGDVVGRGDAVCEVETDKGVIEVQTFTAGRVHALLVEPGARVPVGTVLARFGEGGGSESGSVTVSASVSDTASDSVSATGSVSDTASVSVSDSVSVTPSAPTSRPDHVLASPYARARARELGVDLATVTGTARHGAIHANDVERAALARAASIAAAPSPSTLASAIAAPAPIAAPTPIDDAAARKARMRRAIAATVSRSKRDIPHFYLASTVDLGPALGWLAEENAARPVEQRILPGALLLWAAARAVRAVPELNGRWEEEHAIAVREVHLGVVLSLRGGGLVAPAIADAHTLDLAAIMAALGDVSQRARSGSLRSSEMTGATISVTSLGERGAPTVFPVIFPPQIAMVGFGRVVERPWVVAGAVVPRSVVDVTLAVDHRVVDGHRASLYLEEIADLLAHPEKSLPSPAETR
jgi:pyruvate dehydrogenase E2 component (dihydrolipoamide acetyltransferase)